MEPDFSGYATKAGLKCSDGRTIMPDAFKNQDKMQVPLVWQHGHTDPENVLGHVLLENRKDGVYAYGFFNETPKAKHTKMALEHKDFNALSIWANQLVERSKTVFHGMIREVSLVLSGANPGALIENVHIRHSGDDEDEVLDDEAIITVVLQHDDENDDNDIVHNDDEDDEFDTQEVIDSMSDEQKEVFHRMIGEALVHGGSASHAATAGDGETIQDVYDSMSDKQKQVLHFMIGEALQSAGSMGQSDIDDNDNSDESKGTEMKHNVFENKDDEDGSHISHSELLGIIQEAKDKKKESLKEVVEAYALAHGITDIDTLFPDAKSITDTPELFSRRTEWVNSVMGKVRKTPFSRVRTLSADLTVQEARAKGYITGSLKKEEFFKVSKRVTNPTTIYKKQKLERDDMVDITDFDVVAWLKGEMRLMLDEEIARAILVGDGRAADDEDKIDEDAIRPVANDHELYTTTINVNIDDTDSNMTEVTDAITLNRSKIRGSGLPTLYTTETYIAKWLMVRDTLGRRIYKSLDEVAAELRVSEIVPVEVLEEYSDIVAILVNMNDYNVGATAGGQVSMFDDFDIDYNQYKYLIETRCSGALIKLKAAMVVRKVAGAADLVVPAEPDFDPESGELTITNQTGVVYRNADTDAVINAGGSPYTVASGDTYHVHAEPDTGYYFSDSDVDDWYYTAD